MKLLAIAIVMTLLGGCTARESDDIVKLRLTQEFAKDERTFHECADWARESLGEDASAAEQMELTNSCLHMQTDLQDREADIKEKEKELETAKRELQDARQKIEDARRKREAERERELEETKRQLEEEKRKREAAEKERAQTNIPQSAPMIASPVTPLPKTDEWENSTLANGEELEDLSNRVFRMLLTGQWASAEPLALRLVRLTELLKGRNHADTATALSRLASVYHGQGDYSSALKLRYRSLAIYETALGKNHPNVASSLHNIALTYSNRGDYLSAVIFFRRALTIKDHFLTREFLANTYEKMGEKAKADAVRAGKQP